MISEPKCQPLMRIDETESSETSRRKNKKMRSEIDKFNKLTKGVKSGRSKN